MLGARLWRGVPLSAVRRQLTLFVSSENASDIESLRQQADPVQFALIAAHVTLCREDEIVHLDLETLRDRLNGSAPPTLAFGPARRFGGHGILLPCIDGAVAFQQLRVQTLAISAIAEPEPHLTIAHPRNPRASGNESALRRGLSTPLTLVFREVALFEQRDADPWVAQGTVRLG